MQGTMILHRSLFNQALDQMHHINQKNPVALAYETIEFRLIVAESRIGWMLQNKITTEMLG
jgi:hypothetical protein